MILARLKYIQLKDLCVEVEVGIERVTIYRVIHKSFRKFRNRLRNNQDRHGRKEHINR